MILGVSHLKEIRVKSHNNPDDLMDHEFRINSREFCFIIQDNLNQLFYVHTYSYTCWQVLDLLAPCRAVSVLKFGGICWF